MKCHGNAWWDHERRNRNCVCSRAVLREVFGFRILYTLKLRGSQRAWVHVGLYVSEFTVLEIKTKFVHLR